MTEQRPILFSGPMVRALLYGSKTQTRRIVKPQPTWDGKWFSWDGHRPNSKYGACSGNGLHATNMMAWSCPYGRRGDHLWVRETWNQFAAWQGYFYAADDHSFGIGEDDDPDHIPERAIRWRPSIHMPRSASRITLEITDVRVARLHEISDDDAIAEGITRSGPGWSWYTGRDRATSYTAFPKTSYRSLWESINGADSWDANPWVWVVTFKRVSP